VVREYDLQVGPGRESRAIDAVGLPVRGGGRGDRGRSVRLNLLSNAVKFTPDGGTIAVRAHRGAGEVEAAVQDTGIGIAPEDRAKVFDEFQQVGRPSDRSREGTGLGLTLAKRFIELHSGRIWVESRVGTGTTFTFALPVDRAAPVGLAAGSG
jgi:signal transduction histidine kinase